MLLIRSIEIEEIQDPDVYDNRIIVDKKPLPFDDLVTDPVFPYPEPQCESVLCSIYYSANIKNRYLIGVMGEVGKNIDAALLKENQQLVRLNKSQGSQIKNLRRDLEKKDGTIKTMRSLQRFEHPTFWERLKYLVGKF